jgi:hypothetical protein
MGGGGRQQGCAENQCRKKPGTSDHGAIVANPILMEKGNL